MWSKTVKGVSMIKEEIAKRFQEVNVEITEAQLQQFEDYYNLLIETNYLKLISIPYGESKNKKWCS